MYRSFTVKNYRGFEDLTVNSLKRINLIAGKNNVGKTALLEALWIHHGAVNPDLGLRVDTFRGVNIAEPANFMRNLFFQFNQELAIEFLAKGDWSDKPRLLKMQLQDRPTVEVPLSELSEEQHGPQRSSSVIRQSSNEIVMDYTDESGQNFSSSGWLVERQIGPGVLETGIEKKQQSRPHAPIAIFLGSRRLGVSNEDVGRYSELEVKGEHEGVTDILKEIEPRLQRLAVVSTRDAPTMYADIDMGRLIPVPLMGDGMTRLLSLALAIATVPDGMVVVDEIENGLHHSVMQRIWTAVATFARKYNVQIFATTHSEECIQSAHLAFASDEDYDFRLYRLERTDDKVRPVMYDREMLEAALVSGLEVR